MSSREEPKGERRKYEEVHLGECGGTTLWFEECRELFMYWERKGN